MLPNEKEDVSSIVEIGDDYYTKHYTDIDFLKNEWNALEICSGTHGRAKHIQKALYMELDKRLITLEYNPNAISLLAFTDKDIDAFCCLLTQLISVLHHCHRRGIVHGDIKPSNILYSKETGDLTLIDFAASMKLGIALPHKYLLTASYSYLLGHYGIERVTTAIDWWALSQIIKQVIEHQRSKELNRKIWNIIDSYKLVLASDLTYYSIMKS